MHDWRCRRCRSGAEWGRRLIRVYRLVHHIALERNPDPFRPARGEHRWNTVDTQVAYAGESLAIAALELLTYWGSYPNLQGYQLFTIDFSDADVETVTEKQPDIDPTDYQQTRPYGDAWVGQGLRVPSVVLPLKLQLPHQSEPLALCRNDCDCAWRIRI